MNAKYTKFTKVGLLHLPDDVLIDIVGRVAAEGPTHWIASRLRLLFNNVFR